MTVNRDHGSLGNAMLLSEEERKSYYFCIACAQVRSLKGGRVKRKGTVWGRDLKIESTGSVHRYRSTDCLLVRTTDILLEGTQNIDLLLHDIITTFRIRCGIREVLIGFSWKTTASYGGSPSTNNLVRHAKDPFVLSP
jgi:hypothetical protein